MIQLSSTQQKVLDIYHNEGHIKAWNYWKLMGNTYGIFLGEVPSNEFIDGESLANHIGLNEGVLYNIDAPWLKFILDGNIIYVAKKPLMHSVSCNSINECGAVFENEGASITIDNNEYDITLLHGLNDGYKSNEVDHGYDIPETHNSEWNRLMYPIHSGIHTINHNPSIGSVSFSKWMDYHDNDLITFYDGDDFIDGYGAATWTQESTNSNKHHIFGVFGITSIYFATPSHKVNAFGWRPALRLLKKDP